MLENNERFGTLGASVERLEDPQLAQERRLEQRLRAAHSETSQAGVRSAELLKPRRPEDGGNDLWRTFGRSTRRKRTCWAAVS